MLIPASRPSKTANPSSQRSSTISYQLPSRITTACELNRLKVDHASENKHEFKQWMRAFWPVEMDQPPECDSLPALNSKRLSTSDSERYVLDQNKLEMLPKINVDVRGVCKVTKEVFGDQKCIFVDDPAINRVREALALETNAAESHSSLYPTRPNTGVRTLLHQTFMTKIASCIEKKPWLPARYCSKQSLRVLADKEKRLKQMKNIFKGEGEKASTKTTSYYMFSKELSGKKVGEDKLKSFKRNKIQPNTGKGVERRNATIGTQLHQPRQKMNDPYIDSVGDSLSHSMNVERPLDSQLTLNTAKEDIISLDLREQQYKDPEDILEEEFSGLESSTLRQFLTVLRKQVKQRTPEDNIILFTYMRQMEVLNKVESPFLRRVAASAEYKFCRRGFTIAREGEECKSWCIILKGEISFYKKQEKNERESLIKVGDNAKEGEHFGESEMRNESKRPANVVAVSNSHLLVINKVDYEWIERQNYLNSVWGTVIPILQKDSFRRTEQDIQFLFHSLKNLKAFGNLPSFIFWELCMVMRHRFFEYERCVFRQGEKGTTWWVILHGEIDIILRKPGEDGIPQNILIGHRKDGDCFGEMAIINDQPRTATVMTTRLTDFIVVDKDDYQRIIKYYAQKEVEHMAQFLGHIPCLASCPADSLRSLAKVATKEEYGWDKVIVSEGQNTDGFYFIQEGYCDVFKSFVNHAGVTVNVYLGRLERYDHIGDELCLASSTDVEEVTQSHQTISSALTVRAGKGCEKVVVVRFSSFDFINKLKSFITISKYCFYTKDDVKRQWESLQEQKLWKKKKTKMITLILKERHQDPQLSLKSYLEKTTPQRSKVSWKC